jgi:SAM-dependent methyltransferase
MLIPASELDHYMSWDGPVDKVDQWPVYVDFDASILDRDQLMASGGGSMVARGGGLKGTVLRLIRWLTTPDAVSRANIDRFIDVVTRDQEQPTVLVVGGGTIGGGVRALYTDPRIRLISFDIYGDSNVQFIADAHSIPLRDGIVDAVLVQAVLEHVLEPSSVVAEIHRVLRADGIVYAETPFLQHVHEGPYDFTRFTESGHRWLFRNFAREDSGVVTGPGVQAIWSIGALVEAITRSSKIGRLARAAVFWLRFLDDLIPYGHQVDGACGVYFLGRRSERPIKASEIPSHYLGAQQQKRSAVGR